MSFAERFSGSLVVLLVSVFPALAVANAQVGIADSSAPEGHEAGTLRFTLTRTGDADDNLVIEYQTEEVGANPATSGVDFVPAPAGSSVRIQAQTNINFIDVPVLGEFDAEADETFLVRLTRAISFSVSPGFPAGPTLFANGTAQVVASGDLDGDGKPDLAVVNNSSDTVSVFRNASTGDTPAFDAKLDFATGDAPHSLAIGDLDGDGKADIAVADSLGDAVSVLRNTSSPGVISFDAAVSLATGVSPDSVAIADFDRDGKPDLATANFGSNNVSVLRNTSSAGALSFTGALHLPTGDTPIAIAAGDLNGDGAPEIAVTNNGDNTVSVLRNTSGMSGISFAQQLAFATGSGPISVAIGDLDGDDRPDLAIANDGGNSVSLLLNNLNPANVGGAPSFANQVTRAVGARPFYVLLRDLNGDGAPEVIVANKDDNTLAVLRNTRNAALLAAPVTFGVGAEPQSVATGDFNGDGRPDLASSNFAENTVSVLPQAPGGGVGFSDDQGLGTLVDDDTDHPGLDTTPARFRFVDRVNVPLNAELVSNAVVITGIVHPAPISVENGEFSIGCNGDFTSTPTKIRNGQRVCVRHTSAASVRTRVDTRLTVGGLSGQVSDVFSTTTVPTEDITPNAFKFQDRVNAPLDTTLTSNAVVLSGFNSGAPIEVVGGLYSLGCNGNFTAASGTAFPGQKVCVRHVSAGTGDSVVDTTLTVGGISDSFSSRTVAVADTSPNAFRFADRASVNLGVPVTSNAVMINGINTGTGISVDNGEYSIGCKGDFTNVAGSILPGQKVCVRHVSSTDPLTATDTTLTIGGMSDVFTSTTTGSGADDAPNAFAFPPKTNVAYNALVTSATLTPAGFNTAVDISIENGVYSIGCLAGGFTTDPGTLFPGEKVCVRHTSANVPGSATPTLTTLTLGATSGTFQSTTTTAPVDSSPNPFRFADRINVTTNTEITSNAITVTGLNTSVPIRVTGGSYSLDCGKTFTTAEGTVSPGQRVCVRHVSASGPGGYSDTTLTIGGVSDSFTSRTVNRPPDTMP